MPSVSSPVSSPSSSAARSRRTIWLLVAASTFCYLTLGCYVAVLPGYVLHHLDLSSAALGVAMGATGVVAVCLRPMGGSWGDRYGRRPLAFVGALVLGAGAAALVGPGLLVLVIFARLLTGAGDALFTTAVMAWGADAAEPERRGRAMATIGMSLWLGLALGPQWAVWMRDNLGYDGVWLGATAFSLLAALLVALVEPRAPSAEEKEEGPHAKVPRGAVLPAVAMVLICYGNAVFEAFGIVHLTARGVSGGAGIGGAASVFTVVAVVTFLGRFAGGVLSDRLSPRPVALVGVVLVGAAYCFFAAASSFAVAAAGGALLGLGLALVYPSLSLLVTRAVPPGERGAGLGVFLAALDVTFAIGPPLGSAVVGAASTGAALWSSGAVCLLALPVVIAAGNPGVGEDSEEGFELAEELPPNAAV
ncbi:MAG TPA: MFS transporter [Solirubrobacterales bacterium]|nr:MFS transporter [Solirubrobacterales bacterium]